MSITKDCTHIDHIGNRTLTIDSFYKIKAGKYGVGSRCKTCSSTVSTAWQSSNKDKALEINKVASRRYRKNNKAKRFQTSKKWRENNADLLCFLANKRRTAKLNATPSWFEESIIRLIYAESKELEIKTGIKHEVHHIVPLQEDPDVCGLHCLDNLIILPKEDHIFIHSSLDNLRKSYYT